MAKALVDTGCEQTVIMEKFCLDTGKKLRGPVQVVSMLNGHTTKCNGNAEIDIEVTGCRHLKLQCLVAPDLVCGVQLILGMDAVIKLGGVSVSVDKVVKFGDTGYNHCVASGIVQDKSGIHIDDSDFSAEFDGHKWVVKWKWKDKQPELKNLCSGYRIAAEDRKEFDNEVKQWISDGWLEEHNSKIHGKLNGIIPLMAAKQPNKPKKVRPVMDYRELNNYIKSNPGMDTAVCQEKLRNWRSSGGNACLLDLKKAYLQLHIDSTLQRFQAVEYNGKSYVMTRMGFGLSVAPKIMSRILAKVLSMDVLVEKGTDHYIDDIWVNEDIVSADYVKSHLLKYGHVSKDPVSLDNTRVLGLRVIGDKDKQIWKRDGALPVIDSKMTKRELFSVCGKLIGHYPVANWLRVACSYVKRLTNAIAWNDTIPAHTRTLIDEILQRVYQQDPVEGSWNVPDGEHGIMWCDASSIAIGVCLEVNGCIVEDAAWLRKEDDGAHINVAELEAVLKGITLALKWKLTKVDLITDSATVFGWVNSVIEDTRRPKVNGLSEMIIRQRLVGTIGQLIEEYNLVLKIRLVRSAENIADVLTRVPQK